MDADQGRPAAGAGDPQPAVDGADPLGQAGQAAAAGRVGAADAVVADLEDQPPWRPSAWTVTRPAWLCLAALASSSAAQ